MRRSKRRTSLLSTCFAPCFRPAIPEGAKSCVRLKGGLLCTISIFRIRVKPRECGKGIGADEENGSRYRFACFDVRPFSLDCSKHADVVTDPIGPDRRSVS